MVNILLLSINERLFVEQFHSHSTQQEHLFVSKVWAILVSLIIIVQQRSTTTTSLQVTRKMVPSRWQFLHFVSREFSEGKNQPFL